MINNCEVIVMNQQEGNVKHEFPEKFKNKQKTILSKHEPF